MNALEAAAQPSGLMRARVPGISSTRNIRQTKRIVTVAIATTELPNPVSWRSAINRATASPKPTSHAAVTSQRQAKRRYSGIVAASISDAYSTP